MHVHTQAAVPALIFNALLDAAPTAFACPGLTNITVNATLAATRANLTTSTFAASSVVGAVLEFNSGAVDLVTDLPFVASVGLVVIS